MEDLLHADGFLGTSANFAADMTLLLSILVAICFTGGAFIAKKAQRLEALGGKGSPEYEKAGRMFNQHKWIQTLGAVINVILVLWLMILPYRDFILRDSGGPRVSTFYAITTAHAVVGLFAYVIGIYVVLRGHNIMIPALKFNNYKPWMRVSYLLYMLTTVLGIWVYAHWFITIANPPLFK
jgi:hypothetical protein